MLTYHQAKANWSLGSPQEKKMVTVRHSHRLYLTNSISDLGFFNGKGDDLFLLNTQSIPHFFGMWSNLEQKCLINVDTWHRQEETIYGYCEESYKIYLGQ